MQSCLPSDHPRSSTIKNSRSRQLSPRNGTATDSPNPRRSPSSLPSIPGTAPLPGTYPICKTERCHPHPCRASPSKIQNSSWSPLTTKINHSCLPCITPQLRFPQIPSETSGIELQAMTCIGSLSCVYSSGSSILTTEFVLNATRWRPIHRCCVAVAYAYITQSPDVCDDYIQKQPEGRSRL